MGIFDSLKNMTNQAVKNNVSKAVSGAVNNAMHICICRLSEKCR